MKASQVKVSGQVAKATGKATRKGHFEKLAKQCMDNELEAIRVYWRRRIGLPERIVNDPRPLSEIK